ncbi:MAG: lipid II flippase MurJ, partial [Chlamydiota bacterium]
MKDKAHWRYNAAKRELPLDTSNSILRSARHFFAGTLLSRLSGMLRDIAMAFCFGSAPEIAAFMVSYRLANLFRRLLGEGNLQAGFVPHFETLRADSPEKAASFYRDVSFSLAFLLLGVIGMLEIALWGLWYWAGPEWREIAELAMWMAPGLFFICLYALKCALLQCQKKYFLPAAAPVIFNFVWIIAVFFVWHLPKDAAVRALSIAITLAFAGQWLVTIFSERQLLSSQMSGSEWLRPNLFSKEWKLLIKPLSLGIIGIGAVQFNSAFDAVFARLADAEGPAFLWFAIRIEQLPLALFGIALSGALLPPLSRAIKKGDFPLYRELLQ